MLPGLPPRRPAPARAARPAWPAEAAPRQGQKEPDLPQPGPAPVPPWAAEQAEAAAEAEGPASESARRAAGEAP
eukprot:2294421-Alexandrium_andersonii.AAC.1